MRRLPTCYSPTQYMRSAMPPCSSGVGAGLLTGHGVSGDRAGTGPILFSICWHALKLATKSTNGSRTLMAGNYGPEASLAIGEIMDLVPDALIPARLRRRATAQIIVVGEVGVEPTRPLRDTGS